jgi:predicted TIM-barrel fold metal-dependent hydrolase
LVERAVKLEIPVMVHTGFRPPARVERVGELADRYPDGVFINAHMVEECGLNKRYSHIRMAKAHSNVYLECSYVPSLRRLSEAVSMLGDDRVLFGSDYPLWHGRIDYCISVVENAPIPQGAKQGILGENMARLLHLGSGPRKV